jgi:cysteinyl-tRNA synthetase
MWEWIREANRSPGTLGDSDLREMLGVLALANLLEDAGGAPAEVVALADERLRARAESDFERADELRAQIAAAGWSVRDSSDGFDLTPLQ